MKKQLIYNSILILFAFTSCEEFLDEPKPSSSISSTDVFSSEDGVRAFFNGIYRNLRTQWSNEVIASNTDTWGIISVNIARVMKGNDVMNPSGWYQWDYRYENKQSTYRRVNFIWNFFYETINQTNVLIQGVEEASFPESVKNSLIAEARAIRGWAYFELIREYQHTLMADPNAPGIPLYDAPAGADSEGKPRGTVQQVYDFIVADLEFAIQHIPESRLLKSHFNTDVVNAILARVYLEVHDWEKARDAAIAARENYPLAAETYGNGFNNLDNDEWIWGFPQSADQTTYYGTPASFFDHRILGYDNFYINDEFVSYFTETDVRYLFDEDTSSQIQPYQRFTTIKFEQSPDFTDDFVMIRSAEMYLIEAEARAELNDASAADVLFELQSNRDPSAVASGNTGQTLVDEILLERRKELYGEIGVHFLDSKRKQRPLTRVGNHPAVYKLNFPANADDFILKIPQDEIDANVNITESDQNP